MREHVAMYGNVAILRAFCEDCNAFAFVVDGNLACCGASPTSLNFTKTKRITVCPEERQYLSREARERILQEQDYRCLYCERRFGSKVLIGARERLIRIHWDHKVPFSFSQDNRVANIAAACQFCNGWKSSMVFQTIEEIQIYVKDKWTTKESPAQEGMLILREGVPAAPKER